MIINSYRFSRFQILADYITRVEADGGIVEDKNYVLQVILKLIKLYPSNIYSNYITRVEADGGVVESQPYVLQTITDLN